MSPSIMLPGTGIFQHPVLQGVQVLAPTFQSLDDGEPK